MRQLFTANSVGWEDLPLNTSVNPNRLGLVKNRRAQRATLVEHAADAGSHVCYRFKREGFWRQHDARGGEATFGLEGYAPNDDQKRAKPKHAVPSARSSASCAGVAATSERRALNIGSDWKDGG